MGYNDHLFTWYISLEVWYSFFDNNSLHNKEQWIRIFLFWGFLGVWRWRKVQTFSYFRYCAPRVLVVMVSWQHSPRMNSVKFNFVLYLVIKSFRFKCSNLNYTNRNHLPQFRYNVVNSFHLILGSFFHYIILLQLN